MSFNGIKIDVGSKAKQGAQIVLDGYFDGYALSQDGYFPTDAYQSVMLPGDYLVQYVSKGTFKVTLNSKYKTHAGIFVSLTEPTATNLIVKASQDLIPSAGTFLIHIINASTGALTDLTANGTIINFCVMAVNSQVVPIPVPLSGLVLP